MRVAALALCAIAAWGCATYGEGARSATPADQGGQWTQVKNVPLVLQAKNDDCGAAALASVVRYWGYPASPQSIEAALGRADARLQAADMKAYAESVGLSSYVFFGTMKDVVHELERGRPVIVGLGKSIEEKKALSHYEVVVGYEPTKKQVLLLDPGRGFQVQELEAFGREWAVSKAVTIVAFPATRAVAAGDQRASLAANEAAIGTRSEADTYAAREAASPEAQKYRAGDIIIIGGTTLAVILLIVLIIILV